MHVAKNGIIKATEELLWEKGYSATSPKMILAKSGVGQGSLYHFFNGKPDLASVTLQGILERKLTRLRNSIFDASEDPETQLKTYLTRPTKKIDGCQMGRMTYDADAMDIETIKGSIINYFDALHELLVSCLQSLDPHKSKSTENIEEIAWTVIANVQGAFLLARTYKNPDLYDNAINGLWELLLGKKL